MALFHPARTFKDPAASQSGMATPGDGAQRTGSQDPLFADWQETPLEPRLLAQGFYSWANPGGADQRGFPEPEAERQTRSAGEMPNVPPIFGGVVFTETPYYDRGAAAFVPNFGKVLTNPIGAGIVALHRPQASYGGAAQYADGALWWTNQIIPTSVNLQGLTSPEQLLSLVGGLNVQAMVRTG